MKIGPITNVTFLRSKRVESRRQEEKFVEDKSKSLKKDEVTLSKNDQEPHDYLADIIGENTEARKIYEEERAIRYEIGQKLLHKPQRYSKENVNGK